MTTKRDAMVFCRDCNCWQRAALVAGDVFCATCGSNSVGELDGFTHGACSIHYSPLHETHPADVENGPHASDTENELACNDCEAEQQLAFWQSCCIAHRLMLADCLPCTCALLMEDAR